MKNLNLTTYGVEEMSERHSFEVNGGLVKALMRYVAEEIIEEVVVAAAKEYISHCQKNPGMSEVSMNSM